MTNLQRLSPNSMVTQQLERDIAKFIKDKAGKGPDSLEIRLADDMVVCFFQGFMTKAEEAVMNAGFIDQVCVGRVYYLVQFRDELDAIFKRLLNRKIKYLFPGFEPQLNLACWTIFLD